MGNKRIYEKIDGLQKQIDIHLEKIENEWIDNIVSLKKLTNFYLVPNYCFFQEAADNSLEFFKHICFDKLGEHYNLFNYDPNQSCDGNNIQPIYDKGNNSTQ